MKTLTSARAIQQHLLSLSQQSHPGLAAAIAATKNQPVSLPRHTAPDFFSFLAHSVVNQQLSVAAGRTIWQRLLAVAGNRRVQSCCIEKNSAQLLQCGLSRNKLKTLLLLNQSFNQESVEDYVMQPRSYAELQAYLTRFHGIGPWTVDMAAIFYFGLPDVWPEKDVALQRGGRALIHPRFGLNALKRYQPYRSYLACYIWRWLDSE